MFLIIYFILIDVTLLEIMEFISINLTEHIVNHITPLYCHRSIGWSSVSLGAVSHRFNFSRLIITSMYMDFLSRTLQIREGWENNVRREKKGHSVLDYVRYEQFELVWSCRKTDWRKNTWKNFRIISTWM